MLKEGKSSAIYSNFREVAGQPENILLPNYSNIFHVR